MKLMLRKLFNSRGGFVLVEDVLVSVSKDRGSKKMEFSSQNCH